jgi:hypothetical protein
MSKVKAVSALTVSGGTDLRALVEMVALLLVGFHRQEQRNAK